MQFPLRKALVGLGILSMSWLPSGAQTASPPERRHWEGLWRDIDSRPNEVAERLQALLGPEGMAGPAGTGPEIAVSAVSPRSKEILLTALLALQREKNWHGHLR